MKVSAVVAAVFTASLVGCGGAASTKAPAAVRSPAPATSIAESSRSAGNSVGQFCAGARRLGLEQKINLSDGSSGVDPSLLPKLHALSDLAPAEIAPDFALFVTIEDAVLGGTAPDSAELQRASSPATESRLAHVSSYVEAHCGTG